MEYASLIIHILELVAALSGFYYLRKNKDSKLRIFVYFLVITVFVDALGSYTRFSFTRPPKSSLFHENYWLFNVFVTGSLFFYIYFYSSVLINRRLKKVLSILTVISIPVVIYIYYKAGFIFFETNLKYSFIWTTFSVFLCVSLYFYEVLMSDNILTFYKSAIFYISIGLLVWWLIMPLMIFYMPYYKKIYPEVVQLRGILFLCINFYLYGCYTIGFLWGKEQ